MKLKTKIYLFSTILTVFILISSFSGIYYLFKKMAVETEYSQLEQSAKELVADISRLDSVTDVDAILRGAIPLNGYITIRDEDGNVLIRLQSTATAEKIQIDENIEKPFTISEWEDEPILLMEEPIIWPTHEVMTAQFVQPLTDVAKNMDLLKWVLIFITLLAIIPTYLASSMLVRLIIKPIGELTTTMQNNIENGSFERIQVKGKDEIAAMGQTYNELMDKIEESFEKQRQFIGNASHELKTPLTVIESYAKLLKRRGFENVEVTKESIDAIASETSNMKMMIEQMLELARTTENVKMNWQSVSIKKLLVSISEQVEQAYNRKVLIQGEDVTVLTDEAKLKELLFILIDNARKYSEDDIAITVKANEQVDIAIQDKGIGIPESDIPHLFDRFYRVNKDRNRKTGGTGLGLAIASQLAKLLKAELDVKSQVGVGTSVTITLPYEN